MTVHFYLTEQLSRRLSRVFIASIIPLTFLFSELIVRTYAGPFWHWYLLDPSYFYLLDALNLLNGHPPGHIYHPGVTVHGLNAFLIWAHSIFTSGNIVELVLNEPERYLKYLSNFAIFLNALSILIVGIVGRLAFGAWLPAILCQMAPFMSSIILKHSFIPKPEALLVFATCLVITLMLCGRGRRPIIAKQESLAIYFGILGGFILATKITASPILVLPIILLRGKRPKLVFIMVTVMAFAFFFLPAIGAIEEFVEWIKKLVSTAGSHGSGATGLINLESYSDSILKLLKRPSLRIPLIFASITICLAAWRYKHGYRVNLDDFRGLLGICAAQLAQVILVAKQATAFYMIPSYMLASVSILFSIRLLWEARPKAWCFSTRQKAIGAVLLATIFIAAQSASVVKLSDHFQKLRVASVKFDVKTYKNCARFYNYSASSPVFAMYLANYTTGSRFSDDLRKRFSPNDYWIDDWWQWEPVKAKNWDGVISLRSIIAQYPCVVFRGTPRNRVDNFLLRELKSFRIESSCQTGPERIRTLNIRC